MHNPYTQPDTRSAAGARRCERRAPVSGRSAVLALLLGALGLLAAPAAAQDPASLENEVWSATLTVDHWHVTTYSQPPGGEVTVDDREPYMGCSNFWRGPTDCASWLSDHELEYGGETYEIVELSVERRVGSLRIAFAEPLPPELRHMALRIGGATFVFDRGWSYWLPSTIRSVVGWGHSGLNWTDGQKVQISLSTPAPPGGLLANAAVRSFVLEWYGPSDNSTAGTVTGYHVEFKESGAPDSPATAGPGTGWVRRAVHPWRVGSVRGARLGGLTAGTPYDVRVRAAYAGGVGPWAATSGTPVSLATILTLSANVTRPAEGRTFVTVTGTLNGDPAPYGGFSVNLAFSGTATALLADGSNGAQADYRNGLGAPPTAMYFPLGSTTSRIWFNIIDDAVAEPDETIVITAAAGNNPPMTSNTLTLTIRDNDAGAPPPSATPEVRQQAAPPDLAAKVRQWRDDPRYSSDSAHTGRWDRVLLALGETVADTSLTPMTAAEAQTFLDRGWTRWQEVVQALQDIERAAASPPATTVTMQDDGSPPQQQPQQQASGPHAALIADVRAWRDDPDFAASTEHTGRWDRVLLALGETVADTSLTPMTAAEAQAFADRGWSRWIEVAEALRQVEAAALPPLTQDPVLRTPDPPDARDPDPQPSGNPPAQLHAGFIATAWATRNDPAKADDQAHHVRWDRVLVALGEPVAGDRQPPMTTEEALTILNHAGWTGWDDVVRVLDAVVTGTSGGDALYGTSWPELVAGLDGDDALHGLGGDDELRGGDGDDDLTGGDGRDRFVFFPGDTGANAVTDFAPGDVIVLKGSGWPSVADIIAGVQAVGTGDYRYTLAPGLTVETTNNQSFRTQDFVLED